MKDTSLLQHDELRFKYKREGCHQHYLGERNQNKTKNKIFFCSKKNVFNRQQ